MRGLFFLFLLIPFLLHAQDDKGVRFEHNLSWAAIQAKAKAENKYIFMDCFTTWCGPCKYMSAKVFPQEAAGKYFNDKFISVGVQLDTSKADNDTVKAWYADAHSIAQQYGIRAYPTFLVFAPDGRPLHRLVGSSPKAEDFIARVAQSFDPGKQYYTLLDEYKKGNSDSAFLRKMADAAWNVYDRDQAVAVTKAWLATQRPEDLYTAADLNFIFPHVGSDKDPGFDLIRDQPQKVDAIMGEGQAEHKIMTIIVGSIALPQVIGKNVPAVPDWAAVRTNLAATYPQQADEAIAQSRIIYYQYKDNWTEFQGAVVSYMKNYGAHADAEELNEFAWDIFQHCPDMTCVSEALEWSRRSFKDNQNPAFIDTYANILYKMGRKEEAIAWEQKALALVPAGDGSGYQQTIDKMKKGEKTWD